MGFKFDPTQRYRIQHADGSVTMVFPDHGDHGRAHHLDLDRLAALDADDDAEKRAFLGTYLSRDIEKQERKRKREAVKLKRRRGGFSNAGIDFMGEARRRIESAESTFIDIVEVSR